MKQVFTLSILLLAICLAPAQAADKYDVVDIAYFVDAASFGLTNTTTPDIRGICYNAVTDKIIISEDTNEELAVLNPLDGSTLHVITNAGTGDPAPSLYRVKVSSDGQLYTSGFAGTVRRIGPDSITDASAAPVVIASASYPASGNCRTLFVNGSYTAGTVNILTARGAEVYIWQQQGPESDVFSLAGSFTGTHTGPTGLWANDDLTVILTQQAWQGSRKWIGAVGSGYTQDTSFASNNMVANRDSIDVLPEMDLMVGGGSSNTQNGMVMVGTSRYLSSDAIGGSTGNTTFWWNDGLWVYTGTIIPLNGPGGCAIDSVNHQVYGVCGNGLLALELDIILDVESWQQY